MRFQALPGSLLDKHIDQCQPLILVNRFGKQLPIAVIIEAYILLTHLTPPRNATSQSVSQPAIARNRLA